MEEKIEKTKDYDMFQVNLFNRPIIQKHVQDLVDSISKNNYLKYRPIVVNSKFEVLDGQHRLEAARELKTPIYFQISDDFKDESIITLNNVERKWRYEDYLNFFCQKGVPKYLELQDIMKKYDLSLNRLFLWISLGNQNSSMRSLFKTGHFNIPIEEKVINGIQLYQQCIEIMKESNYRPHSVYYTAAFTNAMREMLLNPLIDHKRFIDRMRKYCHKIRAHSRTKDFVEDLVMVYNFQMRTEKVVIVNRGEKYSLQAENE